MREHIHTIPVLEALNAPGNCPFCVMRDKLTQDAVNFIMGPAYMEDDVRMETNKLGFCAAHLDLMYAEQNRLGLALLLHTHLQQLNRDVGKLLSHPIVSPTIANEPTPGINTTKDSLPKDKRRLFGFKKSADSAASPLRARLAAVAETCYVCRMVEDTSARYMDTFFMLWRSDQEAAALIAAVPGYCLPHFSDMLKAAEERLNKRAVEQFLSVVLPVQQRFIKEMENDLEWFTLKFDYRNADAPWNNAKDALPRAMALLHGTGGQAKQSGL